jgi:hypothetical protein
VKGVLCILNWIALSVIEESSTFVHIHFNRRQIWTLANTSPIDFPRLNRRTASTANSFLSLTVTEKAALFSAPYCKPDAINLMDYHMLIMMTGLTLKFIL